MCTRCLDPNADALSQYASVRTNPYVRACMYELVRTSLYVRVCTYESVHTKRYERICTILYVQLCTYTSACSLHVRLLARAWRIAIHKTMYFALFLGMVIETARKCAQPHRCVFNGYSDGNAIHTNFQRGPPWPNGMYSRFAAVANRNRISARNVTLVCTRCLLYIPDRIRV